jgi:hypothetical protein
MGCNQGVGSRITKGGVGPLLCNNIAFSELSYSHNHKHQLNFAAVTTGFSILFERSCDFIKKLLKVFLTRENFGETQFIFLSKTTW